MVGTRGAGERGQAGRHSWAGMLEHGRSARGRDIAPEPPGTIQAAIF